MRKGGGALFVSLFAVAAIVLTVAHAFVFYVFSFNTPHTPLEGALHPPADVGQVPVLSRRLVVMLVDGVSFDVARALPEFAPLRETGAFRPIHAEFPTYTCPGITSMVTGLVPRDSGMRVNGNVVGPEGLDTFPAELALANVPMHVRARDWKLFIALMHATPTTDVRLGRVGALAELLSWPIINQKVESHEATFVYLGEADLEGHQHGRVSPEFEAASHHVAHLVARYAERLDPERDALVVVSDHGHLEKGGHGGVEPEVSQAFFLATGPFVRRGAELSERPMRDIASTLSVLSGVRAPTSNLGRPMLDALTLNDAQNAALLANPFEQGAHLLCRLAPSARCSEVDPLATRLRSQDPSAWRDAQSLFDALYAARESSLASEASRSTAIRVSVTLAIFFAAVALLWVRGREGLRAFATPRALAFPLAALGVYAGYYAFRGYGASYSPIKPVLGYLVDSSVGGVLAITVVLLAGIVRPAPRAAPAALLALPFGLYALLAAYAGWDPAKVAPPAPSALVFEGAPLVVAAALAAVGLAFLSARRDRLSTSAELR